MAEVASEDIRAAVAAGILSEAQAAELSSLAAVRSGRRGGLPGEDEPFEFFRGFSEIFVTVGLVLVFLGIEGLGLLHGPGGWGRRATLDLAAAVMAWGLAEYFTRGRRMSLPSIALASFFALNCAGFLSATSLMSGQPGPPAPAHHAIVVTAGGLAAMLAYYGRFRLPFASFLIGLYGAGLVFALAALINPDMFSGNVRSPAAAFFDLRSSPTAALATLVFGAGAFLAAMRFDLRDPHRVSRYSASAFWLHLLAAPALVNTLAFTLYRLGGAAGYLSTALALVGVAVLALIIDRRSFLTAGLVYLALLIGLALRSAAPGWSHVLTLLLLGVVVTKLGTWWVPIRASLLRALPDFAWKARLPPYAAG